MSASNVTATYNGWKEDVDNNRLDMHFRGTRRGHVNATGMTVLNDLMLGLAGTGLGTVGFSGSTSGVVTMQPAATAGTWTFTLPPDNGDAGEQLQTDGSGVSTWEGAGSMRAFKNVLGLLNPQEALRRIREAPVYEFTYKRPEETPVRITTTGDHETHYLGVLAEDAPWVMHHKGRIFSPVSAAGHCFAAIAALATEVATFDHSAVQALEARLEALTAAIRGAKNLNDLKASLA